jgi:hypothetical protein
MPIRLRQLIDFLLYASLYYIAKSTLQDLFWVCLFVHGSYRLFKRVHTSLAVSLDGPRNSHILGWCIINTDFLLLYFIRSDFFHKKIPTDNPCITSAVVIAMNLIYRLQFLLRQCVASMDLYEQPMRTKIFILYRFLIQLHFNVVHVCY